jgi:hypothetical protein
VTTGATDAYAGIQLKNNTAGNVSDAYFDDLTLTTNTPAGNVNLLLFPLITPGVQNISGPKIWS